MKVILAIKKFDYDDIAQEAHIFDSWQSMINWAKKVSDKVGEKGSFGLTCEDGKTELRIDINHQAHYFDIVEKEIIEV